MTEQGNAEQAGAHVAGFLQELAALMEKYGVDEIYGDSDGWVNLGFGPMYGYGWGELQELRVDLEKRQVTGRLYLGHQAIRDRAMRLSVDMLPAPKLAE